MKKRIKITVVLMAIMIGASCKKESSTPTPSNNSTTTTDTATQYGTLEFHLHTYLDADNEVQEYNIVYTTDDGRQISLSLAQAYISDIQAVKLDGSTVNVTGKNLLKVLETETYIVGKIPAGNYKSVRFKIGLDSTTNTINPSASADSAILNQSAMWFGTTAQPKGYVFLNLQGKIDTTASGMGSQAQMQPFVYKIGTNTNHIQIAMPDQNFTIVANQAQLVHIIFKYYTLFSGIKLNQSANLSVTTPTENATAPGTIVAKNISSMFEYEQQ